MKETFRPGSLEWASFRDWIESGFGRETDSVVLAKTYDSGRPFTDGFMENLATFSYLVDPDEVQTDEIFSSPYWDLPPDFSSLIDRPSEDGELYVDALNGKKLHPLLQFCRSIGDYRAEWRVWPALEDFFDLRPGADGNLYDPYTGRVVVKLPEDADNDPVVVRTDYLREYLSARRMLLVRQHDHTRFWDTPIEELGKTEDSGVVQRTDWGCYLLNTVNQASSGPPNFSRLVAKDFIPPYETPHRVSGKHRRRPTSSACPEFIVRKKVSGELEKQQPSEHNLGPPVFFDPKVLKRYYDQPSLYSAGFSAPGLGGASGPTWSISLGRNEEGVIIAWLGDFLKQNLPLEEIRYWHTYNIEPRGGMAQDFWRAQMALVPPSSPSLERRLLSLRYHLKKSCDERDLPVFRPYEGPDCHAEKMLRQPLYDEHPEFHEAVRLLSLIFVEYLDVKNMRMRLGPDRLKDRGGKKIGPIVLFSNYLEDVLDTSPQVANNVKKCLQRVQAVRSKVSGIHRFSDKGYQDVLKYLDLKGAASGRDIFQAIAAPLADALEEVCLHLGLRDHLWWLREDSVYGGHLPSHGEQE
jgi:hypothetical protein